MHSPNIKMKCRLKKAVQTANVSALVSVKKLSGGDLRPKKKKDKPMDFNTPQKIADDFSRYVGSDDPNYIGSVKNNLEESINRLINEKEKEESHFEDIDLPKRCLHPGHNPPSHLHIPQGKRYIHICPACRQRTVMQPLQISFSAHKEVKDPRTILKENGYDLSWMSSRYTENVLVNCMEQYANQFKTQ